MKRVAALLAEHPFLAGLEPDAIETMAGCARNVRFDAGTYICREGEPAGTFLLLRKGRVALETHAPGRGPVAFQTLGPGQMLGVSWLVPPHRWEFDARVLELTRALSFDAVCLRGKCDADHSLGYRLMLRFVPELVRRMQAARLQSLNVYGATG
jgi:CRP/FNR family transcriptional regulator, cyclic AMP receptor protein